MGPNEAKDCTAAEWRDHRIALEEWRAALLQYIAAWPPDRTGLRDRLFALMGAAEDAMAAAMGRRPHQSLALVVDTFDQVAPGVFAQPTKVPYNDEVEAIFGTPGVEDSRQESARRVLIPLTGASVS